MVPRQRLDAVLDRLGDAFARDQRTVKEYERGAERKAFIGR